MKMWWDIIVWNLNENIGLILIIFNSFVLTSIAFICWCTENVVNLTHLQTNLFLYIYFWNHLAFNKIRLCFPSVWFCFWILTEFWVIQKHLLFGVSICLKQLKVLGVLCSLCKVLGDLGFLSYNQIYLLGIKKIYSSLYNIYQLPTGFFETIKYRHTSALI